MTKLTWDEIGSREYEVGIDRGVFYPLTGSGVPWNGLVSVKEAPSGGDIEERFFDGQKYRTRRAVEGYTGTIEAITYPDEFESYASLPLSMATGQRRKFFGFSYRTLIGNGQNGSEMGYKIHLVYNAMISPGEKSYQTIDDSLDPMNFSWDFTTLPVLIQGRPCSHLVIDSTKAHPWTMDAVENLLYGSDDVSPMLPDPLELVEIFEETSILRVTDNGDGTWTATGPDSAIQMLDATTFAITWDSALYIDDKTYYISSL